MRNRNLRAILCTILCQPHCFLKKWKFVHFLNVKNLQDELPINDVNIQACEQYNNIFLEVMNICS